jgi:hydroxymethylpyrimidine pyrophosphatase-like HAD family hydrolase
MGDNENDRRMLEYAGTAAAPENALPAIRKIADIVTPSNDADGAAWLLRRLAEGDA